jgi:predicted nucleotidyltransferase
MEPQKELERLSETYKLNSLYAFGSRGRAAARFVLTAESMSASESDLDIGVLPRTPLTVKEKVQLALDLEALFDVSRVDLVILPEADPFLAANIIRGERLYARDSYQADEYDLYILRRAGDLAPLERERMALILARGKRR